MPPVDNSPYLDRDPLVVLCLGQAEALGGRVHSQVSQLASVEAALVSSPDALGSSDAESRPDCLVLTDDEGVDTLELARGIRAEFDELPIVLCVTDPDAYSLVDVFDAGVSDVLPAESVSDVAAIRETVLDPAETYRERCRRQRDSSVLDSMLRQLPLHMFVKDDQTRHVMLSDELYDPAEVLGKTDYEAWPEQREPETGPHADDLSVIDTGDSILNKEEYSKIDDRWYLTSKAPWYDEEEVLGLVGLSIDITARKEREQLLRDTSRLLRAIVHASPVPIVVYNENGTVQLWNEAAEEVFGWSASEVIGQTVPPFVPEGSREEFEFLVDRVLQEGSISGVEIQRETSEGETLDLHLSAATVEPVAGDQRVVGILSDVTTLKERERRLRRQNHRIEAFTAILAHDLRNPIQVLGGQLDTADDAAIDTDAVDRAFERIETIIDDVLSLAREAPIVEETDPVQLSAVARDAWEETDVGRLVVEDEAHFEASGLRVERLLGHLYENALQHGPEDDQPITVRVGSLEDGFYVADDGCGIDESDRGKILKPGYSTTPGGTGYGLNVVQEIVAAHGWELSVEEPLDGGVRIEITGVETLSDAPLESER